MEEDLVRWLTARFAKQLREDGKLGTAVADLEALSKKRGEPLLLLLDEPGLLSLEWHLQIRVPSPYATVTGIARFTPTVEGLDIKPG